MKRKTNKLKPQKVTEKMLLSEAERIQAHYKGCFLFGYKDNEIMKFLHFKEEGVELISGINIKKLVMLDSSKDSFKSWVKEIKKEFSECEEIPAGEYLGV